jgi:hypothetical protein
MVENLILCSYHLSNDDIFQFMKSNIKYGCEYVIYFYGNDYTLRGNINCIFENTTLSSLDEIKNLCSLSHDIMTTDECENFITGFYNGKHNYNIYVFGGMKTYFRCNNETRYTINQGKHILTFIVNDTLRFNLRRQSEELDIYLFPCSLSQYKFIDYINIFDKHDVIIIKYDFFNFNSKLLHCVFDDNIIFDKLHIYSVLSHIGKYSYTTYFHAINEMISLFTMYNYNKINIHIIFNEIINKYDDINKAELFLQQKYNEYISSIIQHEPITKNNSNEVD